MAKQETKNGLERLENESPEAYEAYTKYATMGAERSLAKVGQELGKSTTLMSDWSAKNRWVERANIYDQYVATSIAEESVDEMKEMARLQVRQGRYIANTMLGEIKRRIDHGEVERAPLRDIISAYRIGVETERSARQIGYEHTEGGGEVIIYDWDMD